MGFEATAPEYPALVIDGSGSSVFVGILGSESKWLAQSEDTSAPLESLIPSVDQILKHAELTLADIRSYIYSEGPGSVLGLRLCAMAIETWVRLYPKSNKLFAYNSLSLVAAEILSKETGLENALIVSDWKKGAWNAIRIEAGTLGKPSVVDDAQLSRWTGPLYHLPQRKGWQKPPEGAIPVRYDPSIINVIGESQDLLRPSEGVALYSSGINTFQKWTPDRHRAN